MFRLAPVPTMRRTVTVLVPDPDAPDKFNEEKLTVTYHVLTTQESRDFDDARAKLTFDEQMRDPHALQKRVVCGWGDDVVDEKGKPIPFSPEALDRALDLPWFARAVRDEYFRGIAGEPRLGN